MGRPNKYEDEILTIISPFKTGISAKKIVELAKCHEKTVYNNLKSLRLKGRIYRDIDRKYHSNLEEIKLVSPNILLGIKELRPEFLKIYQNKLKKLKSNLNKDNKSKKDIDLYIKKLFESGVLTKEDIHFHLDLFFFEQSFLKSIEISYSNINHNGKQFFISNHLKTILLERFKEIIYRYLTEILPQINSIDEISTEFKISFGKDIYNQLKEIDFDFYKFKIQLFKNIKNIDLDSKVYSKIMKKDYKKEAKDRDRKNIYILEQIEKLRAYFGTISKDLKDLSNDFPLFELNYKLLIGNYIYSEEEEIEKFKKNIDKITQKFIEWLKVYKELIMIKKKKKKVLLDKKMNEKLSEIMNLIKDFNSQHNYGVKKFMKNFTIMDVEGKRPSHRHIIESIVSQSIRKPTEEIEEMLKNFPEDAVYQYLFNFALRSFFPNMSAKDLYCFFYPESPNELLEKYQQQFNGDIKKSFEFLANNLENQVKDLREFINNTKIPID